MTYIGPLSYHPDNKVHGAHLGPSLAPCWVLWTLLSGQLHNLQIRAIINTSLATLDWQLVPLLPYYKFEDTRIHSVMRIQIRPQPDQAAILALDEEFQRFLRGTKFYIAFEIMLAGNKRIVNKPIKFQNGVKLNWYFVTLHLNLVSKLHW